MKRSTLVWIIWGTLLLGQIVLDAIAFPRLISQSAMTDRLIYGLVVIDLLGIGAWIVGWYTDRLVTPRTWYVNVIVVLCVVLPLMAFRLQFYAF